MKRLLLYLLLFVVLLSACGGSPTAAPTDPPIAIGGEWMPVSSGPAANDTTGRVFEWQYDVVEKDKVADPDGADWSVVFGSILSLEMGRFVRYKFKVTDPMMTCPTCTKEFGPRHPSVYVKGDEDRIFCKKDCAKKWAGIPT